MIAAGGPELAQWLTAQFGNIFGNRLVGATGYDVAAFYKENLFRQKGGVSGLTVDAQFMALALSVFFTNQNLAGHVAEGYGFQVSDTGVGAKVVNVGSSGAAFGVNDNSTLTILQLLLAANAQTDVLDIRSGFATAYDRNGDGLIDAAEGALRAHAHALLCWINELSDR